MVTFIISLSLMACTVVEPLKPAQAQTIIALAWQADQHVVWALDWPAAPTGGPLTVETWQSGPAYRYEILESAAPALVGEVLVSDGQRVWRYNRLNVPERSPDFNLDAPARLSPLTDALAQIDRLLATTPLTATQESAQTIHGPAQKITLTYTNGDSLSLWQDDQTGLPVRVMSVINGQPVTLNTREVEPLVDPPTGLFEPIWPAE
jgi:outer membrane lipoprotein-sorting protein